MEYLRTELCWFITTNCNKACSFCHSFYTKPKELSYIDNNRILLKIINAGINSITISGGEPFLYMDICDVVKELYEHGIKITMISNGYIPKSTNVYKYIEELVFSLDSVDAVINELNGRGAKHQYEVIDAIRIARENNPEIQIRVNSLVCKTTKNSLKGVGLFLRNNNILKWRLFKFAALRGKSKLNKDRFQISNRDYISEVKQLQISFPEIEIQTRYTIDYETKYLLLLPNGDVVKTIAQEDKVFGNILDNDLTNLIKTSNYDNTSNT